MLVSRKIYVYKALLHKSVDTLSTTVIASALPSFPYHQQPVKSAGWDDSALGNVMITGTKMNTLLFCCTLGSVLIPVPALRMLISDVFPGALNKMLTPSPWAATSLFLLMKIFSSNRAFLNPDVYDSRIRVLGNRRPPKVNLRWWLPSSLSHLHDD